MNFTQANSDIDENGINANLCAIEAELGAHAAKRGKKLSALVMGGGTLSPAGLRDFDKFACEKNVDVIYVTMSKSRPHDTLASSKLELSYFATDGISKTQVSKGGRLWMRDRKSQPRLIFNFENPLEVYAKSNGQFHGRIGLNQGYHEEGFDFARQRLQKRLATMRPSIPVMSLIGSTPVIFDMQTLLRGMAGQ